MGPSVILILYTVVLKNFSLLSIFFLIIGSTVFLTDPQVPQEELLMAVDLEAPQKALVQSAVYSKGDSALCLLVV